MQTTQNYPHQQTDISQTQHIHTDPRIPQIVKRLLEGADYTTIAKELSITRKALYNIRCKADMRDFINRMWDIHLAEIAKYAASELSIERMEAFRERGRVLKHVIPSKVESRSLQLEIQAKLDLTDRRLSAGELLEKTRAKSQLAYEVLKQVMLEQE